MHTDDVTSIRLLAEGGSLEVFGHKKPDSSWSFRSRITNLDFDDEGNEIGTVGGRTDFEIIECHHRHKEDATG